MCCISNRSSQELFKSSLRTPFLVSFCFLCLRLLNTFLLYLFMFFRSIAVVAGHHVPQRFHQAGAGVGRRRHSRLLAREHRRAASVQAPPPGESLAHAGGLSDAVLGAVGASAPDARPPGVLEGLAARHAQGKKKQSYESTMRSTCTYFSVGY